MRKIALLVLVLVALGSFAGGQAWAGVGPGEIQVFFFNCSSNCESQDVESISGGINCPNGQQFFLRVNLRQFGSTRAVGRASGVCTGSSQLWTTNQVRNPGALDCSVQKGDGIVSGGKGTIGGSPVSVTPGFEGCGD